MKSSFNLLTGRENNELVEHQGFLIHKGTLDSFTKLQAQAKKDINADLQIVSSFRDYNRQEIIWNNKASGYRPVFDDQNTQLHKDDFSELDYVKKIMRFSALPGSSRHHWGTDLDIFDARNIEKKEVQLIHKECIDDGPCSELHTWLDEQINLQSSFGFFRPYENDLGGVSIEKWHLSHAPIAMDLFNDYTIDIFIENLHSGVIVSKEAIIENLQFFYENFVKNIKMP
jgi:LAS superfamily LD-carboxypeptidase LdcB